MCNISLSSIFFLWRGSEWWQVMHSSSRNCKHITFAIWMTGASGTYLSPAVARHSHCSDGRAPPPRIVLAYRTPGACLPWPLAWLLTSQILPEIRVLISSSGQFYLVLSTTNRALAYWNFRARFQYCVKTVVLKLIEFEIGFRFGMRLGMRLVNRSNNVSVEWVRWPHETPSPNLIIGGD